MIEYEMIKEFNKYLCEISNEPFGIKDNNLLKSVSVSAEQEVFGQKLYPTIEHKISYIVTSIIKNHMFINANKRTACMVYEYLCEKYNITPINDNSLEINILKIVKNKFDINYSIKLLFNKIIKEENMENKKVPASYRIALGQIKRYFGDSKPTEKEVKKIAVEIAKRNKLDDTEFFMKWALGQIGTVNEDLDEAIQIKSEISAIYFIKECIDLEKDSNIKNKLKSVLEFLSKKFKFPIEE